MTSLIPLRRLACCASMIALLSACGTGGDMQASAGSSSSGSGGSSATALSLPQFVHGAARVDTDAFSAIPIVVAVSGAMPGSVDVTVDGVMTPADKDGNRFVATIDTMSLGAGAHAIVAEAKAGGGSVATVTGSLVVGSGSLQFTEFSTAGPAYNGHLVHDVAGDSLVHTWISTEGGKHALHMNRLDGAFARLAPDDLTLNDPADDALGGYTAFGNDSIGVVYRTPKPNDGHWLVKMRVVDPTGQGELAPPIDLTDGQAAFSMAQAGADPSGVSAAWLHIQPALDPSNPPPVEIRFARWDLTAMTLVGPITLDSDQPQPTGSSQGPLILEPLAEIGIACNADVCLVAYSRDVYNTLVGLNVPKLFLAVIDLASGTLKAPSTPVEEGDWDTQMFGQHLVAQADGSFVLVYTANDTVTAVTPATPCDNTIFRDLLFAVKIDATGKQMGLPAAIFDHEGAREYPRIAPHPAGFALFWEDQRSECAANGHIRMAANVTGPDLSSLLDPYLEMPGSIGLPPEDPTLAVTGTSFVVGWSDNRHGDGLLAPENEIYLDTYWRK